jgi:beta-phosphoglucomutase-like phosphatase (HAD superfamily)
MREVDAAGIRIGIVTSASRATLRTVLRHSIGAELADRIDVVVGGEDVAQKKPAPDLYLVALARLDVAARDCVAIEDSAMGLAAATAAGVATVITTNDNTLHEEFDAAALVLDSLGEPELPALATHGDLPEGWVTVATLLRLVARGPAPPLTQAAAAQRG